MDLIVFGATNILATILIKLSCLVLQLVGFASEFRKILDAELYTDFTGNVGTRTMIIEHAIKM